MSPPFFTRRPACIHAGFSFTCIKHARMARRSQTQVCWSGAIFEGMYAWEFFRRLACMLPACRFSRNACPGRVPYISCQVPEVVTVARIGKERFVKYNFMKKLSKNFHKSFRHETDFHDIIILRKGKKGTAPPTDCSAESLFEN